MDVVRQPAVAGTFYPADAGRLQDELATMLGTARQARADENGPPKALIAPHAGYVYSGPIAATAFCCFDELRGSVRKVVLLGPSHFVAFPGVALPEADSFATPLGEVQIDREAASKLAELEQVIEASQPHAREHCLEVELPFLQEVIDDFVIVPLVTGQATPDEVAEVLDAVWGEADTAIVVSSDLSHYYDYDTARRLDARTAEAIEQLRPDELGRDSACGRLSIQGLLISAQRRGLSCRTLDLRSSGDTAGPRDEVVGYGAFAFG